MRLQFLISVGCLVGCGVQAVPAASGGAAVINQCSTADVSLRTDCPRDVCGLNGIWMGTGVPFRTLHLEGGENEAHLSIQRAVDSGGKPIDLHLQGDALTATARGETTAKNIRGASLFLGPSGSSEATYKLTITDVTSERFWAECNKPACSKLKATFSKQYHFTATRLADGCALQVCDPSLSDNPDTGIAGTAAVFRDDYYDDATYSVSSTPPPDPAQKNDLFNIACRGTDIYKLYMLRHAQVSATSSTLRTTLPQRTTLLRALSGSYCAHGRNGAPGSHFTHDGVPIDLRFNPARSNYSVTPESGYQYVDGDRQDALWSTLPELPALCITSPRTASVGEVLAECDLPICEPGRDDDYLMTATSIPPPPPPE